jgi:tetratricopeptide (TPR) repeat protein
MNIKFLILLFFLFSIIQSKPIFGDDLRDVTLKDLYFSPTITHLTESQSESKIYSKAILSLTQMDYIESERRLSQIINLQLSPVYNLLGVSSILAQRYDRAIFYLKSAIEISPDNLNPYLNLGMVYIFKKNWSSLLSLSKKLLLYRSETGDGQLGLGIALYHLHKLNSAKKNLEIARKIMRRNKNPRVNVVNEYLQRCNITRKRFFNFEK